MQPLKEVKWKMMVILRATCRLKSAASGASNSSAASFLKHFKNNNCDNISIMQLHLMYIYNNYL